MTRYVPNVLTLLNLISGSVGVILSLEDNLIYGALCINLGALFDFLDGLLARSFCHASDFGKHLDSLADLISFGLLPSVIMYALIELHTNSPHLPYVALLITLFSALRLARFNLGDTPLETFVGLPTPANDDRRPPFLAKHMLYPHIHPRGHSHHQLGTPDDQHSLYGFEIHHIRLALQPNPLHIATHWRPTYRLATG